MGKKDLEQLFKETFKEFHEVPDEKVWKSIEDSLDKKRKKKRVVPIWWRLGGVAALLAVLFYVINPFDGANNDAEIIITNSEENTVPSQNESIIKESEKSDQELRLNNEENLVESSNENGSGDVEDSATQAEESAESSIIKNQSIKTQEQQVTSNTTQKGEVLKKKQSLKNYLTQENESNVAKSADQNVALVDAEVVKTQKENSEQSDIVGLSEEKKSNAIAAMGKENNNNVQSSDKTQKEVLQEEKVLESITEENAVAQNEEENEKRSIFEVIKEQEEEVVAENTSEKWSIGPSVAPVYFNATGEGSPIHSNFASNSKSGNVNLSYGLTVAYNVGKRLKVRSGVHRVDFGYDTNEVLFSSSLEGSTNELIDNISYSQTSRNLVLQSKNSTPQAATNNDALFELAANESPALDGKMVQQLGYIEVPLELDYALVDKKFGINLIGGISSLFLVDNSVLLESEGLVTEVGEANNANSVNFSTNVGIGLNYEFSPKMHLNLEPVFKYQLNTFSETAGAFRPFSVGVYSGVTFKF
ncbi:hypothetical protein DKG77_02880 [Flagellimonas aquimarina]|uniref:Uncharacterized protein n=1 Tax=Flagellimonas aquimarina TaxID=2201895 RepID=A0A316L1U0_9FLAO|nr:outer membrane beta-barrel protein [Allomuricauda koreensis]PWL39791.1 hypothetical protein DKG77_02880 [Allomuricauda koreensis]